MAGATSTELAKDAFVFLGAAGLLVPILRWAKLPTIIGFVLAGILLGPYGLGQFADDLTWLNYVTISDVHTIEPFGELGVLFLLFILGLEASVEKLWALRRIVFGGGLTQTAISTCLIGLAALALGQPPMAAFLIGLGFCLSSTAIVMELLAERRRITTNVGRSSLGLLLFQDLLVAPILILIGLLSLNSSETLWVTIGKAVGEGVAAIMIIVVVGRFALRPAFTMAARTGGRAFLMALTLFIVLGAALLTEAAGLSVALGAFLAGVLLGETEFKQQVEVDLEPFKSLLLGLFFMTVGMSLNLLTISSMFSSVIVGVVGIIAIKLIVSFFALRLVKVDTPTSLETAALLAPSGEFAFIIFGAALTSGVMNIETTSLLTAIAGLSMILIPVMGYLGRGVAQNYSDRRGLDTLTSDFSHEEGHVIVAGFGRVGRAVARILIQENAKIVALDTNSARVSKSKTAGWNVFLGDASRPEILMKVGAEKAALFVVTVDDGEDAVSMVRTIRAISPLSPILARAKDTEHALLLEAAGATYVVPDAIEAGLRMAGRALEDFGVDAEVVRTRLATERDQAYLKATG